MSRLVKCLLAVLVSLFLAENISATWPAMLHGDPKWAGLRAIVVIGDTQNDSDALSQTLLDKAVDWIIEQKECFDAHPGHWYNNFDPADMTDAAWDGRTNGWCFNIVAVLQTGDIADSESGTGIHGKGLYPLHRASLQRLTAIGIPVAYTSGNHDFTPLPTGGSVRTGFCNKSGTQAGVTPTCQYCNYIDDFSSDTFYGAVKPSWYVRSNPAFATGTWEYDCASEGYENYEDQLHTLRVPGDQWVGDFGIVTAGFELAQEDSTAKAAFYAYLDDQTDGTSIPWIVLAHQGPPCEATTADICGSSLLLDTNLIDASGEIAMHVGGHWITTDPLNALNQDSSNPGGANTACECVGFRATKNDANQNVTMVQHNFQSWDVGDLRNVSHIRVLVVDELYGGGAGRLWHCVVDAVAGNDWLSDYDSCNATNTGGLMPIEWMARRQ